MSCLDDSDDHLRWLAPTDLNLDYMGITHLDCVTRCHKTLQCMQMNENQKLEVALYSRPCCCYCCCCCFSLLPVYLSGDFQQLTTTNSEPDDHVDGKTVYKEPNLVR